MLHVLFGLAVAVLVLAAPFASRRLRFGRVPQAEGAGGVPPAPQPAGGTTVPVITGLGEREPFAYDNGVLSGHPGGEGAS